MLDAIIWDTWYLQLYHIQLQQLHQENDSNDDENNCEERGMIATTGKNMAKCAI